MTHSVEHNSSDMERFDRIQAEAADWFAKHRGADVARSDKKFQLWLENPEHAFAYEQCKTAWCMAGGLYGDSDIQAELRKIKDEINTDVVVPISAANRFMRYQKQISAIAASVLFAVGLAFVMMQPSGQVEYVTKVGEQRLVKLEDGSSAMLNTDTRLVVDYDSERRGLKLVKGEAYFSVTKDYKRPFEVDVNGSIVRAVGTAFNISMNSDSVDVDVAEGVVHVETVNMENNTSEIIAELNIGEAVNYEPNNGAVTLGQASLGRIQAWQEQKIYFDNIRLSDAVDDYNRYLDSKILIADSALREERITGIFNIGDTASFVFTLEQALNAHVKHDDGKIIVSKKL